MRCVHAFPLVVAFAAVLAWSGAAPAAAGHLVTAPGGGFSVPRRLGWYGGNDWEPAIAADASGHVHVLYKYFDAPGNGPCHDCVDHVVYQVSADRGVTWSAPAAIASVPIKGGQYDSQIAVDPVDGRTVWAAFLQNANSEIGVVESTDVGQTWSHLRIVSKNKPGVDKDILTVRGQTVAVAYDDGFNTWATISRDGGKTWSTHLILPGDSTYDTPLCGGGGIDSHGNIYFSWMSFSKAGGGLGDGPLRLWVTTSRDGGVTWARTLLDVSGPPPECWNCGWAFLASQMALRVGADDTIYLLWNGSPTLRGGSQRLYFARSTDQGATYSRRQDVSPAPLGVENAFPAILTGQKPGDVRIGWMDNRAGAWNLFYRASTSGGAEWGRETQVSRYLSGYAYLTPAGFGSPYGDYFWMAADDQDHTHIAWGEGLTYATYGNIWTAYQ